MLTIPLHRASARQAAACPLLQHLPYRQALSAAPFARSCCILPACAMKPRASAGVSFAEFRGRTNRTGHRTGVTQQNVSAASKLKPEY